MLRSRQREAQQGGAREHSTETYSSASSQCISLASSHQEHAEHFPEHSAEAQQGGATEHSTETYSLASSQLTGALASAPEDSDVTLSVQTFMSAAQIEPEVSTRTLGR